MSELTMIAEQKLQMTGLSGSEQTLNLAELAANEQKLDVSEMLNTFRGPAGPQGPAGSDADVTAQNIERALGYTPADKTYMVASFEELKALILAGNTEAAIAVLDQAILDNAVLA